MRKLEIGYMLDLTNTPAVQQILARSNMHQLLHLLESGYSLDLTCISPTAQQLMRQHDSGYTPGSNLHQPDSQHSSWTADTCQILT